jgi:DNA-binding transcriptional ArsR family regulator
MNDELTIVAPEQLRALGHPLRLRILEALNEGAELSNRELATQLGVDPGHLHFHVRLLHRAGLIERGRTTGGREKPYRAAASALRLAPDLLDGAGDERAAHLDSVERAWRTFATGGSFGSAQLTVRVTADQLAELVRDFRRRAAALEQKNGVEPLVVTLFSHPAAGEASASAGE